MPSRSFPTLYLNENINIRLVGLLSARGINSIHTISVRNRQLSDLFQLEYAAQNNYIILTHNRWDYRKLHEEWTSQGKKHAGIIGIGCGEPDRLADRVARFFRDIYPTLTPPFYQVPPA